MRHGGINHAWAWCGLLAGLGLNLSCSGDTKPRGELILSMQTDMQIPKDVDRIRLEVESFGTVVLEQEYEVDPARPESVKIPATIGLLPGREPERPITISLSARQRGKVRTLREVVTTVPTDRIALLRMPIQWLCDGMAIETAPRQVDTTCPEGRTCIAGSCEPSEIDSETLPDYEPEAVFGGGDGTGSGSCFDTVACFASGTSASVDGECSITLPMGGEFEPSVAIVTPPGSDGICGSSVCLVPLDAGSEAGWTLRDDGRAQLPLAVCDRLGTGQALGVAVTTACPQKTDELPTCGPWSSVEAAATFDASAPANITIPDAGGSGDCAVPPNSSQAALCVDLRPEAVDPVVGDATLDGNGTLVVELFADPAGATPITSQSLPPTGEISINEAGVVRFDALQPGPVYVFAAFWDNPDETSIGALSRGGGWLGGIDLSGGLTGPLQEVMLVAGSGQSVVLPMQAVRRLTVSASPLAGATFADDGNGELEWRAYATEMPALDAAPHGRGGRACVDLETGLRNSAEGFVVGSGPHRLVVTLDDFGVGAGTEPLGALAGSLMSGSPGAGTWTIPVSDGLNFPQGSYARSFSMRLGHTVAAGAPAPAPYRCSSGTCEDGQLNGGETDVDCGAGCTPCTDTLQCAGPADCASRVCTAGACAVPTCTDGVQNGTETDSDCGGGCPAVCADGMGCQMDTDCSSARCVLSVCQAGGADAGAP